MIGSARHILVALHFVCPLIFFTNLTRNPYISQIALLNIGLLLAGAWALYQQSASGEWSVPRTRLDLPIAVWMAVCAASWLYAYFGHAEFFQASMRSEGIRAFLFVLGNSVLVFYLAAASSKDCEERPDIPLAGWAAFVLIWGFLWTFYPDFRGHSLPLGSISSQIFNSYGAFLWVIGVLAVLWLARSGTVHSVWHVVLAVGFLSSAYGICQYFGYEFLWPRALTPYGGRSVSTFGNPNFMSSYQVMLLPLAIVYYLQARTGARRFAYAALFLVLEAGLFCSLTRSSWVGGLAALAPLLLSRRLRRLARENMESHGLFVTLILVLAFFWPRSMIGGYTSSLLGRLGEIKHIFEENYPYSPWYQRVLIWMSSWTMGAENPILGKGYGLFELFYPFYQGHFLDHFDFFRNMRTHANNSHNEIIEVWAQTGILGVGVFFWTWTVFFRGLWSDARPGTFAPPPEKKSRKEPPDNERVWLLAGGASVFGMLVDNLLNVSIHFAVPAFLFWWQAGTVAGHVAHVQGVRRRIRFPVKGLALAAAAAVSLGAAYTSWYWVGYWNREVHYFTGFKMMRNKDFSAAIVELEKAYDWNPFDVNNNYELANAYARSGQRDEALAAYKNALRANAGYDEIYFNAATVLVNSGKNEEALDFYRISWAINPLSLQLYRSLSAFYLQDPKKYAEDCIELLERGTHFFPGDLNLRNHLGYLYSLTGRFDQAEKIYRDLLRTQPHMAMAEKNLRVSLTQSGHPKPPILFHVEEYKRLEADIRAKRLGTATLHRARKVAEWFPSSLAALIYHGNLELVHGDAAKASVILSSASQMAPDNVAVLMNLGIAYKQQGKFFEARNSLSALLAIDPNNARAQAEIKALPR